MENTNHSMKYFIAMIVAMLFWGIAWTVGKIAVAHSNAEVSAFWRYAISFISILPLIWYLKTPFKSDKLGLVYMVGAGLLTALFNYLFFVGVAHGQAGYGGTLVTSLSPIITYLLSIAIFGVKVSTRQIIALSIGIIGAIILLQIPFEGFGFLNVDSIYFVLCAIVWTFVTLLSQKASQKSNPMFYTLVVFAVTSLVNMYFALPYHPFDLGAYDQTFWISILFMGLLSGTFSTTLFFISASKIGAHRASVFMFIVPIGAIVSSYFVFGEKLEMSTIIGCILAFIAVVLFNLKRKSL
ncbi:MAG: DMT family transporter [Arcobacteraceae bacterium]|jgi:drug/metabolite transporter (DMT)-like permease|nr:DMT family transporter [Arcobacteraceae bacterium]